MDHLRSIVFTAQRATLETAETQRVLAISNLENAISDGGHKAGVVKRLQRLLHTLTSAAPGSAQRKLEVLQSVVVPALISMGLAEEM